MRRLGRPSPVRRRTADPACERGQLSRGRIACSTAASRRRSSSRSSAPTTTCPGRSWLYRHAGTADPSATCAEGPDPVGSVVERLSRSGLIPRGSEEIVARRIEVFRALGGAHAAYRPVPADLAVTVFSGRGGAEQQRRAWQPLARAGFRQHVLEADRYSLIGPAHAERIAGAIVDALSQAARA